MNRSGARDPRSQSAWRFLPAGIAAWFGVVFIANGALIYDALHTFPGRVGKNAFDISNRYDALLKSAEHEAALGWSVVGGIEDGHPVVNVRGRDGDALPGAVVDGLARRPVGADGSLALTFARDGDGRFVSQQALPGLGQWDIAVTVEAAGELVRATRRVVVR